MTREQSGIIITETARREAAPESSVNAWRRMGTETEAAIPKWKSVGMHAGKGA